MCRCRSTVAKKNSLERPKPRKKPREEPGYEGWPIISWLYRVEIITEHGQDVQMFINDQHGQIIIITVVVEGAATQHDPRAHVLQERDRKRERELERAFTQDAV